MDRRSLLAIVLSTVVIIVFNLYFLPHPKPPLPRAVADSLAALTNAGGTASSTGASGVAPGGAANGGAANDGPGGLLSAGATNDSTGGIDSALIAATPGATDSAFVVSDNGQDVRFVTKGGGIASWALKHFLDQNGRPVQLVKSGPEPNLALDLGTERVELNDLLYLSEAHDLAGGGRVITFTGGAPGGLQVIKRFTVRDNDPVVNLDVEVRGVPVSATNPALEIGWLGGLPRAERNLKLEQTSMTAVASVGQSLEKLQPSRQKTPSEKRFPGAVHWVGTHNKYFFVGILPPADLATEAVLSGQPGEEPTAGAALRVPVAGTSASYAFRLYLGPLSYPNLKPLGMDRAVDLGWKWILPLSRALLSLMTFMYKLVPNYGWVIILLSILIKVAFYPMTVSGLRSMREMQRIQPEMERLRKKYADDPQKLQSAMMSLYKDNRINPVGGCLPLLLQMPVFIALYPVLANSVELRQAPFFGWIRDLSAPDVLFTVAGFDVHLLPAFMAATMFWQQKLTPTTPSQASLTYLMPIMMLFFLYTSPSGLTLYWTMLNILSVVQQYLINREASPTALTPAPATSPPGRGGKAAKAAAR